MCLFILDPFYLYSAVSPSISSTNIFFGVAKG